MSLHPLIIAMQSGDCPHEQRQFYNLYRDRMYMLCKRYVSITVIAQDAMLDGFIRFFNSMHKFQYIDDQKTEAYLRSTMIQECLDNLKIHRKKYHDYDIEKANDITIDENATSLLTESEIYQLIERLPEDLRVIFCLHLDGYTHREIATMLQMEKTNVSTKHHRAKKLLQEQIIKKFSHGTK